MSSDIDTTPASAQLLQIILGYLLTQAIYVCAQLGIADVLGAGPSTYLEMAAATRTDRALVHRLLRLLTSANILCDRTDDHFALTSLGECLRSDVPNSLRAYAMIPRVSRNRAYLAWVPTAAADRRDGIRACVWGAAIRVRAVSPGFQSAVPCSDG